MSSSSLPIIASPEAGMSFFLRCIPPRTSLHAKRIVKLGKFSRLADKPELVEAKDSLDALLLPHQPQAPMLGAVSLTVVYTWPWRSSETQRVRARGREPMVTRPDCSNLVKTLEDRLVKMRFIEDDNAVVDLHVSK